MAATNQVQKNLQAAMREALRIQDGFVAEPLFAKTGRREAGRVANKLTAHTLNASKARKTVKHFAGKKEFFAELLGSVKQAKAIENGKLKPARRSVANGAGKP